jgi:hypothetical protein
MIKTIRSRSNMSVLDAFDDKMEDRRQTDYCGAHTPHPVPTAKIWYLRIRFGADCDARSSGAGFRPTVGRNTVSCFS